MEIVEDSSIETEIARAAIVLTAYSNAGLEAALAGKPVIYTIFHEWYANLGATGCGLRAKTPEETVKLVSDVLAHPGECLERQRQFLDQNPALRDGTSTQSIIDAIHARL